jgi:peptidoglycan/xylan/chitin deacetylase (PgdA/CDA1 family)
MRIAITMCHGIRDAGPKPLSVSHFRKLIGLAAGLGFTSINYNDLDAWRNHGGSLPPRPILFDFDHGMASMLHLVHPILAEHGYRGNLFINTGLQENPPTPAEPATDETRIATWDELGKLVELGWHIGAHTVTHPNLSKLSTEDPTGAKLREELETCDATLKQRLGVTARDFAYTGTSFSTAAEREVKRRYRFGRLWIVRPMYESDGQMVRYADLVNVPGPDEPDGGPPMAARYITKDTPATRLPSMEIQGLIHTEQAFEAYLHGAMQG